MNPEPIYSALVTEGFDPATVPPNSTRAERKIAHDTWWAKTLTKKPQTNVVALKPVRVRKKAASK